MTDLVRGTRTVVCEAGPAGRRHFLQWNGQHPIEPDQVLSYDLRPTATPDDSRFPGGVWWEGPFGATGVAVDIVFDDGSRLSGAGVRDQHDVVVDASAQGASRTVRPDQWNRRLCSLAAFVGRVIEQVELTIDLPGDTAAEIAVGTIAVHPTRPSPSTPLGWVDSLRGTNSGEEYSRGNTVPAVALPNGYALTFPTTDPGDERWPFRFGDPGEDLPFTGLRIGHTPTPWLGDYGTIDIVPGAAAGDGSDSAARDDIRIAPHRLSMRLRSGIDVETVPTRGGSFHRFLFGTAVDRTANPPVVDLRVPGAGAVSAASGGGESVARFVGHSDVASALLVGAPRVHFAARATGVVRADRVSDTAIRLVLDPAVEVVEVEIATSMIGPAQAEARLGGLSFESAARQAENAWTTVLAVARVEGATPDQAATFYSSLARIFLYPGIASERDDSGTERFADIATAALEGSRPESVARRVIEGRLSVGNGFWDTYRTVWPAYALLAPDRAAELLDGFLSHARTAGWMPRWSAPGAVDIMVGTSSDIVLADSLARGVPLEDEATALRSALRNAAAPSPHPAVGRRGLSTAIFVGHTSNEVDESVAWTIENAINDFGILTMVDRALATGMTTFDGVELTALRYSFETRAGSYRALFDHESGFFRARDQRGRFEDPFDPRVWGGGYTETDAWGMAFSSVHDGPGTARIHGGGAALEERLDAYFGTTEAFEPAFEGSYRRRIHEMTEARAIRMGRFALSNQPAHHVPFMYAFTPSPWKTSAITRAALRRQFHGSEIGQGYPGDEDNGEMSAWYVFSALGLYPLQVGTPWYVLTAPLFDAAEIVVTGGRLRIVCENNSPSNDYIQSAAFNGRQLDSVFLSHHELARGGELRFVLGDRPADWATRIPEQLLAMSERLATDRRDLLGSVLLPVDHRHVVLSDDDSRDSLAVGQGDTVTWVAQSWVDALYYTVTCGEAPEDVPSAWTLEASDDGSEWIRIASGRPAFRWPRQTVPYALERHRPFRHLRLVIDEGSGHLSQIEVYSDQPKN